MDVKASSKAEMIHRERLSLAIVTSIQEKDIRVSSKLKYGFLLPNGKTILTDIDNHDETARFLLRKAGINYISAHIEPKYLFSYLTNSIKVGIWDSDYKRTPGVSSAVTFCFVSENATTAAQ